MQIFGYTLEPDLIAQLFWIVVGLAGFAGMFAGSVVNRMGIRGAMILFQLGIAVATVLLASTGDLSAIIVSALIFGAFFVSVAASLGMWSLELFQKTPAIGFGLTFLLLSVGQFFGPLLTGLLVGSLGLQGVFLLSAAAAISIISLLLANPKAIHPLPAHHLRDSMKIPK